MAGPVVSAPVSAGRAAGLTSILARLQLKLAWRQAKTSTGMLVANVVMLLMVLGTAIPLMWGLIALRGASVETRGSVLTAGFALLTIGWPVVVTLMTGNNDMLDAGRFALYPVRMGRMFPGLLLSSGLGLGGLLTVILGIGYVVAWSTSPATFVAALVGFVLGFATCLVSSRALSSLLAGVLRRRKARDLVMVAVVLLILLFSLGIQVFSRMIVGADGQLIQVSGILAGLGTAGRVASWTPFGWAWALPWGVAQGAWGTAAIWLVLAVAWLAGLAWVWTHQFAQSLISPLDQAGGAQKIVKANPLDRYLPATPAGAVAKREMRYWRRDPRRLVGAISMLLMPFIVAIPLMLSFRGTDIGSSDVAKVVLAYCPAMMGYMAAIFVASDISYDGSALATQIVTGVSGRDDRWGRVLAFLVIFGTIQVVLIVGFMAYAGHWELLPGVVGLSAALMLVGAGIGSWMGALWQYPQPPAGSSLAGRNGAGGVAGFLTAMVGMFLPLVIGIPVIVLAVLDAINGGYWGWIALVVGLAEGALVLWWGVRSGGRRLDRTWPEVLAKITWKG